MSRPLTPPVARTDSIACHFVSCRDKSQLLLSVANRYCPAMKKTHIQKAASALSKLGNAAKWAKNDTPEKRRACTAAADVGRDAATAARQVKKIESGQLVFRAVCKGKNKGQLRLLPPLRAKLKKENK